MKSDQNLLERDSACATTFRSQPSNKLNKKLKMTLIVGIVCKDAIVLASEKQTTAGNYRFLDSVKSHRIEFKNGEALIAESGIASLSAVVIDKIKRDSTKFQITSDDSIPKFISSKVREMREEIVSLHPNATPEQWRDYFYGDAL